MWNSALSDGAKNGKSEKTMEATYAVVTHADQERRDRSFMKKSWNKVKTRERRSYENQN